MVRREFGRLLASRRGNVAMIFALAIPVLILLVGGGIDVRQWSNNKGFAADATDAAVLAGAKTYFASSAGTPVARKAAAEASAFAAFDRQMALGSTTTVINSKALNINAATGEVTMTVTGGSKNNFAGVLGYPIMPFTVTASATAGGQELELALILDNTSSMFESNRFQAMRAAAKDYVNTMFDLGGDRVRISVVPWTTVVNINTSAPDAANPAAVGDVAPPAAGTRVAPPAISAGRYALVATPRDAAVAINQADLDALAAPTTWRGCIRSANGEVEVDASGAVTKPISDNAPDTRWPAALLETNLSQSGNLWWCDAWTTSTVWQDDPGPPGPPGDPPPPPPVMEGSLEGRYVVPNFQRAGWNRSDAVPALRRSGLLQKLAYVSQTTCDPGHQFMSPLRQCIGDGGSWWHYNGTRNAYYPYQEDCGNWNYWSTTPPEKVGENKPCLADPNEISYVAGGGRICAWEQDAFSGFNASTWTASPNWTAAAPISGPNINCPVGMLPLSGNRKQVLDKLNEMYPVPGGTMADVGLLWGLRSLSPKKYWQDFWGLGVAAKGWGDKKTRKIAVMLTDGANVAPSQYEGYYGCTDTWRGGPAGGCWNSPNVAKLDQASIDGLMLSACNEIRTSYKVELYVILVDVADAAARAKATACAGDSAHAIFTSTAGVGDAFKDIVDRALRLTK